MKFHLFAAAALSGFLLAPIAMAQNPAPAAAPSTATPSTATPSTAAPSAATPAPRAARAAMPAGQFRTEAEAKAHCPADTVVWVNKETKVFHLAGARNYGKTKSGAYMCQKDATAAHFRAARARAAATTPAATATTPAATAPAATAPAASTAPAATPARR